MNSDARVQEERRKEADEHNRELYDQYKADPLDIGMKDSELLDTIMKTDKRFIDADKVRKDIRLYINKMKVEKPAAAKELEDYFFKRGPIHESVEFARTFDIDKIVKYYPGSPKGPRPEDDPDHYSDWFIRNQPEELLYDG